MAAGQALDVSLPASAVPRTPTTRDPALAVLLACLHQDSHELNADRLAELDEEDWRVLLTLAAAHSVQGLICVRLSEAAVAMHVPSDVLQALSEAARQTVARTLRVQAQITELARAFAAA